MYQQPNYLMHHGVKGMRWGYRRARKTMAKRTGRKESSITDKEVMQWKHDVKKGVTTGKISGTSDYASKFYSKYDGREISKKYFKAVDAEIQKRGTVAALGGSAIVTAGVLALNKYGII